MVISPASGFSRPAIPVECTPFAIAEHQQMASFTVGIDTGGTYTDAVILDVRLPDMSGFEVCRSLRSKSIVPTIIITAQTDTVDMSVTMAAASLSSPDPALPASPSRSLPSKTR